MKRNNYSEFAENHPKNFAYLLRYYVCRMKGLQEIFNQYQKHVDSNGTISQKEKDTYRFIAELIVSMLFEITNVLKNVFPKDYSEMQKEARVKSCIVQLEKLEGLRHSTLHFPDDLQTYLRRQKEFLKYVQNHGHAIGFLDDIIDKFSEGLIDQYPDVSEKFNAVYFAGITNP